MGRFDALTQIDHEPKAQSPAPAHSPVHPSASEPSSSETQSTTKPKPHLPERANVATLERPNGRRIITRNSFEIFEDQMESLRRIAFQDKMEGKLGSMSAMVREAIDTYLLQRTPGT
jgi:hypothetical protein